MTVSDKNEQERMTYREKAFKRLCENKHMMRLTEDDVLVIYLISRSYDVPQLVIQQMMQDIISVKSIIVDF